MTDTHKVLHSVIRGGSSDDSYRVRGEHYDKNHTYNNIYTGVCEALGIKNPSNKITVTSYYHEEQGRVVLSSPVVISKAEVEDYAANL